jgi:nucleotide-binding universal stress UspA family protein
MKTTTSKRKIAETVVGAAVGAAIAGPVGAVAGGLVGSQAAAHTPHLAETKRAPKKGEQNDDDPIVHAQLKRILVPVDFSPPSRRALRFARDWAGRFGSEICLLHVIEPMNTFGVLGTEPFALPLPPPDFHEPARTELNKLVHQEFPDDAKVSVHLRDGVAYDQIAEAARELKADLIIIATHGRTGLSHVLMGSTAERVVRHAPCPVLTLRRRNASGETLQGEHA